MASRRISMMVVVLCVAATSLCCWVADAQSNNCTSVLVTLSPCVSYITGNSTTPSSSCCSQLANVVSTNPMCLCEVINGTLASSLGITVNQTRVLAIPGACKVQTPPISSCNASSSLGSPSGSPSSTGGGNTAPSPTSVGSPTTVSFSLLLLQLFIASSAWIKLYDI